jgi:hypothetical protein
VIKALEGFPADITLVIIPIPGKWSAREIVHHLGDSESTSAFRIRKLLVDDNPVIEGYDEASSRLCLSTTNATWRQRSKHFVVLEKLPRNSLT